MVERDFYEYVKSDSGIVALLGSTLLDSRIYPIQAPQTAEIPYITYSMNSDTLKDEVLYTANVQFKCSADTYLLAEALKDSLCALFDIENKIMEAIKYGYNRYYYSKLNGSYNYKDPEYNIYYSIVNFDVIYLDAFGFILQENGGHLLHENGYYIKL